MMLNSDKNEFIHVTHNDTNKTNYYLNKLIQLNIKETVDLLGKKLTLSFDGF